jgi:hypothetical protein
MDQWKEIKNKGSNTQFLFLAYCLIISKMALKGSLLTSWHELSLVRLQMMIHGASLLLLAPFA